MKKQIIITSAILSIATAAVVTAIYIKNKKEEDDQKDRLNSDTNLDYDYMDYDKIYNHRKPKF